MGKVQKTSFERNWTTFVNAVFALLGKAHPKWWCQTDLVEFDPKGVFSFRPYGETRKNEFSTQLDVFRQPGVFRFLVKPYQNGGMITNSLNSIQGCFFVLPRWGKSKKQVLNAIGRPSSTRLFALLGKAHPKWSYETDLVEFDPKGVFSFRPDWESRKNEFWTQLDDLRQPGFFRCFQKLSQNGGMKPTSWNSIPRVFFPFATMGKVEKTCFEHYWRDFVNLAFCTACKSPTKIVIWNRPRGIRSQGCFFDSPDGESRINEFWTQSDDLRQPGFFRCLAKPTKNGGMKPKLVNSIPRVILRFAVMAKVELRQPAVFRCLEKPTQNGGMKQASWNSIPRVFFRFAPMGKDEKTSFQRNWTNFVNPAFCAACKSPPKMVVWNRPRGIRSQRCFFVSQRWGKSKKWVFNAIGRPSSTRLFAVLAKARQKWWYETEIGKFDSKGDSSFRRNGKGEKTSFERNWTTFVNPAFYAACKSPPKMVVWNLPLGIRSQGCFFVSPRWGNSKKRVLNAIGRPSSTQLFALLAKAHPKWWYKIEIGKIDSKGVSAFRSDEESRKNAFWTHLDDLRQPGFLRCLE